jgi:hypothetical protein
MVIVVNTSPHCPSGLFKASKDLIQSKVRLLNVIHSFGNRIFVGVSVLAHADSNTGFLKFADMRI